MMQRADYISDGDLKPRKSFGLLALQRQPQRGSELIHLMFDAAWLHGDKHTLMLERCDEILMTEDS